MVGAVSYTHLDGRDAVGHHNVLEAVFTDVPFVRQQRLNTVVGKLLVAVGGHAAIACGFLYEQGSGTSADVPLPKI